MICLCSLLSTDKAQAQIPVPQIITEPNTTRAISVNAGTRAKEPFKATTDEQLSDDKRTRVMIFALNFDLMAGDALSTLKVEGEDGLHQRYPLTVENISRVPGQEWLTAITLRLPEGITSVGDLFVRLSYQGVSSNRARVGVGTVSGGLSDTEVGALPAPAPTAAPPVLPPPAPVNYADATIAKAIAVGPDAVRFLEQATFGPTKAELANVRSMGYSDWLNQQFAKPLPTYPTEFNVPVPSDSNQDGGCPSGSAASCFNEKYTMKPLQRRFFQNAMYGDDQLRQRVVFALNQIFVVSGNDITPPSYMAPYFQVLEKHAFGNFRQLLADITLNPAMGRYLDMASSTKNRPNENFGREILQLFSVGLYKLNPDASYVKDDQGNPIPTYDQATINNFAKVFTGWNIPTLSGQQGVPDYINAMKVIPGNHDIGQKILLDGAVIPASPSATSGAADQDLKYALDIIFQHPNVGPFISKQLIQKLVTSNPSPQYIERVSRVFANNGSNTRGDMKAVITAILLDPEARGDIKNDPDYGKLREPSLYMANLFRTFNAKSLDKTKQSDGFVYSESAALDEDVLKSPTVFNFFSPTYAVPGTNLVGPEFGILSTNTVLKRANFVDKLLFNATAGSVGLPKSGGADTIGPDGTTLDLADAAATVVNWADLAKDPKDAKPILDALDAVLMHGTMTQTMRDAIAKAYADITATDDAGALKRARTSIYLVATSSQYQMEK